MNYDKNSDKGYILEVDVEYPENIRMLHRDLPFLPERMKIDKCTKLVCTTQNKENYVVHIRALKQALNHGLKLTKVHRIIEFRQEAWLKPYVDINSDLRKDAKNKFEKDFFKLMNNSVFGKTMENVRNHRGINDGKRLQAFDKVTTFPYGTNTFKVCVSEMLSKNKFSEADEDKNTPKDKAKDKDKDKTTRKTRTKTEVKDKNTPKTRTKTEGNGRNKFIQVFQHAKQSKDEKVNWKKRQIIWVFWDDGHVSELCEKWIYHNHEYAYTRFEELRIYSGEVLFTREHKATTSKDKPNTHIDIDTLQVFKDFITEDRATPKTKTLPKTKTKTKTVDKDTPDKIKNEIDTINKINKELAKVKAEVIKKVELIYEAMCELQDEIYSDDSWLRLVELDKIDAIIDEALNIVWNDICGENRISPEKINLDKHKDIDGYVSKLTDVINNKIELVNRMGRVIDHVMSEIKNEINMIDEKIHKVSEMDNDTLHLINDKLNEIITQSRKKLSKIVV